MGEAENAIPGGKDRPLPDQNVMAQQRTHLANERTFLAWCRTSLALLVFGFVVQRFGLLLDEGAVRGANAWMLEDLHSISLCCFLLGLLIVLLASWRFLQVKRAISRGEPYFTILPEIMVFTFLLVVIVMVLVLVL